jgi:hypothetical protein
MGRTRSAPDGGAVEDGAADSSPQKRSKKADKGDKKVDKNLHKTTEALDDALADSSAEAAMVEGEPSSQTRKAGTERRDLLEQRKKTEEARAEAEDLRWRVKQLEEQRNKALVEANSGKNSAKSSEKSVIFYSIHISARYWHVAWQSKPSANKPAKNIDRAKHVDQEISSGSDDADDAMEPVQRTLTSHCGTGFLRRIAPVMTPECSARIGAHNKTICANMMRAIVRYDNIQGLSKIYDRLRVNMPGAELEVVGRFLRSDWHAYRFHRDSAAALVVSLVQQTQPFDVEMPYIKETVFGVRGELRLWSAHTLVSSHWQQYTQAPSSVLRPAKLCWLVLHRWEQECGSFRDQARDEYLLGWVGPSRAAAIRKASR